MKIVKSLLVGLSLLTTACVVHSVAVPVSTPPKPVGIHSCVPGASFWFDGVSNGVAVPTSPLTTNEAGYAAITAMPSAITVFNVHATAANHDPYGVVVTIPAGGPAPDGSGVDLFVGDCEQAGRSAYPVAIQIPTWPENFVPLPALHTDGEYFKTSTDRWLGIESSDFSLFARWLDGEDITPVLQQRKDLGFNLLRIWSGFCNIPGIAGCVTEARHPDIYTRLPQFLQLLSRYGFYVDLTVYVGPGNEDSPARWSKTCSALQATPFRTGVLLSLVNENDVHPLDLTPFQRCDGVLSSRGSNGSQSWPPNDHLWDFGEFHDNSAPEWWRKGGHNGWEVAEGNHYPVITNEQTSAQNDGNAAHWQDVGANIALFVAGGAFHSSEGKDSVLFSDSTAALARVFVQGMKQVPLYCRELYYERLDPGTFLRAYRRGGDSACLVTIRP